MSPSTSWACRALSSCLILFATAAAAQDYPSRPEPATTTPAEFARLIAAETARWGDVVKKAGVKID